MLNQLKAIIGVITEPKKTFQDLSSSRLYALAFLSPLYFGYARAARTGSIQKMTDMVGNNLFAYAILLIIGLVAIFLGAALVKLIVRLFGKRLTLVKLMNIYGYALVPRLLVSIPMSICLAMLPQTTKDMMLLGEIPGWFLALSALGGIALIYAIVLMVYGIVVSPSYDKAQTDSGKAPETTAI